MVTTLYCYNCPLLTALPDLPMVTTLYCCNCPLLTCTTRPAHGRPP